MIDTLLFIVKMIIAILPFVILCIVSHKNNLDITERSKQFFMPVIAIVYVIIVMIFSKSISNYLIKIITKLPEWISSLADFSWMPSIVGDGFTDLGDFLQTLISLFNLSFWICFIANVIIILVYLLLKKICLFILSHLIKTDGELHTYIASNFYEYFSERSTWCIKENFMQVRSLLEVFYYSTVFISSILMMISFKFFRDGLWETVFYPVFGIIIIGEFFFYLDGVTRREYTKNIIGEDEEAYRIVNYSLLRKFFRHHFKDKLLSEKTRFSNILSYDLTTEDILIELENNEDPKVTTFVSYMKALNKTGFEIDNNYLYSSLDMLNGKSILFNNPFYDDLIPYAFYPMNRVLLSHKKVLVVLGRHAIEQDIIKWLEKGISAITNLPFMWNIGVLNQEKQDVNIGIITRSDVLNLELQNANSEFFENVGFCVIIEPSKLISTAQIGLNMIIKQCKKSESSEIVYCLCDKNCDGLIDSMSHILMTSLTEVSATKRHEGTSSYMCWTADEECLHHRLVPNISRYLGMGTELSLAALKNQVSKTTWYGGETFPVTDMKWISKQYYYDLTKYAAISSTQDVFDKSFVTTPNFWSAEVEKNNFLTVEDEFYNMFEILRNFSTRATEQGFINVISSNYLLRDYMADNASIFEADPKAIPYIVADYIRSNRNTILRLILMMSTYNVTENQLEKEFSLLGIETIDLRKQVWLELYKCYTKVSEIAQYDSYKQMLSDVSEKTIEIDDLQFTIDDVIKVKQSFNFKTGKMETVYYIDNDKFAFKCVNALRSASYIAEDENGQKNYLGSEVRDHIYQKYLPGQFFTFDGKYYEMLYLTSDSQVLVRRASDHINGRPSYRQIREYVIKGVCPSDKIGAQKDISGLKLTREFADIEVKTPGYYQMANYDDFATAKKVLLNGEKNGVPVRKYYNKEILRIELPDFGGKLNDNICNTITVLFNEIFKTIFAENQAYICALSDVSVDEAELNPNTYSISGDGVEIQKNCIYIIEDSQLDLGLVVTVERNLQRIFHIVEDYIAWHLETLETSMNPPVPPHEEEIDIETIIEDEEQPKSEKKGLKKIFSAIGNFFKRIWEKIKSWFKKKPKDEEENPTGTEIPTEDSDKPTGDKLTPEMGTLTPTEEDGKVPTEEVPTEEVPTEEVPIEEVPTEEVPTEEVPTEEVPTEEVPTEEVPTEEVPTEEVPTEEVPPKKMEALEIDADISDVGTNKGVTEDLSDKDITKETADTTMMPNITEMKQSDEEDDEELFERAPYHERYFTLFGRKNELLCVDLIGTFDYLKEFKFEKNPLTQARNSTDVSKYIESTYKPNNPNKRYCDFCGCEIFGVEYETLGDGRDRCMLCSRTAVKTEDEFRKLFEDVKRNMETFFDIQLNVGIRVEMVNARKLHKRVGRSFIPTSGSDGRVLGVAIKHKNGYILSIENGSPRMAAILTIAHELTHIWQYLNWNDKEITRTYGKDLYLQIYEGMAKWVEIQYAYLINEPAVAKREEILTACRNDDYGIGFLRYRANYPFSQGTVITKDTPFMDTRTPLDLEYCGEFVIAPFIGIGFDTGDDEESSGKKPSGKKPYGTKVKPKPTDKEIIDKSKIPSEYKGALEGTIERNPSTLVNYAYELLTDDEKEIYDKLLNSIRNFEPEISNFSYSLMRDQMSKIVKLVLCDHPEIFWLENGIYYVSNSVTSMVEEVKFDYCMTQDEAKKRQEKIDSVVSSYLALINEKMSDYEVVLRIYENIIKNVDYDSIALAKEDTSDDKPDDLRSIYGVFVNRKAVCAGYAKATQYLLNMLGIECLYVTSDTHAWNIVKLEGDYYHLDTTWGDSSNTDKTKSSTDKVRYKCFCITTKEVLRLESHTPDSYLSVPECSATSCNYNRRNGLFFEEFKFENVKSVITEKLKQGMTEIPLKFSDSASYKNAYNSLIIQDKFRDVLNAAGFDTTSYSYIPDDKLFILLLIL